MNLTRCLDHLETWVNGLGAWYASRVRIQQPPDACWNAESFSNLDTLTSAAKTP